MTRSVLIFTFSPVQPFIAQARRAADLYSGSQILVELARAAAQEMNKLTPKPELIYPASLAHDVPNRLVAIVSDVEACVKAAQTGFNTKWAELCQAAREKLQELPPATDAEWETIWKRQVSSLWEPYWAAAEMSGDDFHSAYEDARHALEAAKRARAFPQVNEDGLKDSLSGERSSLRTKDLDGRKYWSAIATSESIRSKLKPEGRERLDALGAVKRFGDLDVKKNIPPLNGFPSTSTIAAQPYLRRCRALDSARLKAYATELDKLGCFTVRNGGDWPYDGDLFFREMLKPRRMEEEYDVPLTTSLGNAQKALAALPEKAGRPSAYYAILALDGDSLGKRINACESVAEAEQLSKALTDYATGIRASMKFEAGAEPDVYVIYNGGDDLLAMTPLENAFQTAWEWKELFKEKVGVHAKEIESKDGKKEWVGRTASAGIAIVHHQAPLSASLRAARSALEHAKHLPGKDAVCIQVLKRSGSPVEIISKWDDMDGDLFGKIFSDFSIHEGKEKSPLSSKFAFSVLEESGVTNALESEARASSLKRLIKRHKQEGAAEPGTTAEALAAWAAKMDTYHEIQKDKDGNDIPQGMTALGNWLVAIRFIAQGGGE